jgi:hypothetical protein
MNQDDLTPTPIDTSTAVIDVPTIAVEIDAAGNAKPPGSYVKHAMRNMVRKRSQALQHFFLSAVGLMGLFIGLAYLTK